MHQVHTIISLERISQTFKVQVKGRFVDKHSAIVKQLFNKQKNIPEFRILWTKGHGEKDC